MVASLISISRMQYAADAYNACKSSSEHATITPLSLRFSRGRSVLTRQLLVVIWAQDSLSIMAFHDMSHSKNNLWKVSYDRVQITSFKNTAIFNETNYNYDYKVT